MINDFADLFKAKSHALVLPRADEDQINRYVAMHSSERDNAERRPFRRQVDFWAFSIAAALAWELEPREGPLGGWGKNFIYTAQGIMDDDLCALLAVVAVAKRGHDDQDLGDPGRIIDLANRLAGSGCPEVLQKLSATDLRTTPLDRAIDLAMLLQQKERPGE